jgi:hypothetical protein
LKNINDINEEEDAFDATDTEGNLVNVNQQDSIQETHDDAESERTRSRIEDQDQPSIEKATHNINGLVTSTPEERSEGSIQQRETRPVKQDFSPHSTNQLRNHILLHLLHWLL